MPESRVAGIQNGREPKGSQKNAGDLELRTSRQKGTCCFGA